MRHEGTKRCITLIRLTANGGRYAPGLEGVPVFSRGGLEAEFFYSVGEAACI